MLIVSVCDFLSVCVEVFALNGWIAGCGSLPSWIRSTWGVSLLWGLCEALWGGLLVSCCMRPIGCFCLTKTQWVSELLKDAVSLSYSLQEIICLVLITSYSTDETLLFWWDDLIWMGPFCVINIWMESECQCYFLVQSAGTSLHGEQRPSSLPLLSVQKRKVSQHCNHSHKIIILSALTPISYMTNPIIICVM